MKSAVLAKDLRFSWHFPKFGAIGGAFLFAAGLSLWYRRVQMT